MVATGELGLPVACRVEKGDVMGKEARIGLLLGAAACLLAVMVDWAVEELS
jgi:hypothetical protein